MEGRDEFLARARSIGMTADEAMMVSDLVSHAVRAASAAVATISSTAPDASMGLLVRVNALNALQLLMLKSLQQAGPAGRQMAADIARANQGLLAELFGGDVP